MVSLRIVPFVSVDAEMIMFKIQRYYFFGYCYLSTGANKADTYGCGLEPAVFETVAQAKKWASGKFGSTAYIGG